MMILCMDCNGSGWKDKILTSNGGREMYIYIPCITCKGQGLLDPNKPSTNQ